MSENELEINSSDPSPMEEPKKESIWSKLKKGFKQVKILFLMQCREKIDFSVVQNPRKCFIRILVFLIEFVVIGAVAWAVLLLCQWLNIFSPIGIIPNSVMSVVFFILFIFSLITCTAALSRDLFHSKDNEVLATYPSSANAIYLSKIGVTFIHEVRKTLLFYVPIFFAFSIISGHAWYIYLWELVMLLLFTVLETLLAGILALPVHYIIIAFRRYFAVKVTVSAVFAVGAVALAIWLISLIPADINLITMWSSVSQALRNFLDWFTKYFYIFYAFTLFLVGPFPTNSFAYSSDLTWEVFLVTMACIVVFFALNILISHYLYQRVSIRQNDNPPRVIKAVKKNHRRRGFNSDTHYENMKFFYNSSNVASSIAVIIIMPLITLLLNSIFDAISTRLVGDYFVICFNILIVLLFTTSSNVYVASIYSRDADALKIQRTFPEGYKRTIFPKLIMPLIVSMLTLIPSSIIFLMRCNINTGNTVLVILMEVCIVVGHILWSAEIDFTHPHTDLFQTSGAAAVNPNETRSIVLSFVLSAIGFGLTFFFLMFANRYMYLQVFIIALVFLIYRIIAFMYRSKAAQRKEV
ncbi:MAG: hypothetical protein LUC16_02635 [Coprobacillus sp.]|nr:hypothetical protein [Coprobacillus sp.]